MALGAYLIYTITECNSLATLPKLILADLNEAKTERLGGLGRKVGWVMVNRNDHRPQAELPPLSL